MRRRHAVTLGMGVAGATTLAVLSGCGESTFGTCQDTNSCLDGSVDGTGAADQFAGDSTGGDTGSREGGSGDGAGEGGVVGEAGCSAPTTLECSGTCVDPTLPANCGSCGNSCVGPEAGAGTGTCTNGACTVGCEADGSTPLNCAGACVDPTQPATCGACGTRCAGPPSTQGQAVCSLDGGGLPVDAGGDGGPCGITCNPTYHACGADCLSDTDDPSADPCVVSNATGVFVAPAPLGTAAGLGTMASPLLTVGAGITKALTGKKRVYVCLGTYGETVSLTSSADGLTVYGGLDCANGWKYVGSGGATATVVATPLGTAAPATALTVTGPMTSGVAFEDVGFTSLDGVNPGDSSVAVFATTSAKLSLTRGTVTAGKGIAGSPGGTTVNWSGTAQSPTAPTASTTGAAGGNNVCLDRTTSSTGGMGGSEISLGIWGQGANGSSSPPVIPALLNGGDGGNAGVAGTGGGPGASTSAVGAGSLSSGDVTVAGWVIGAQAGRGSAGSPGQGGGGGGGGVTTASGGGGGAGGCGGGPGLGGSTGGSSLAILAYQSALSVTNVTVASGAGGIGGSGGSGQSGQGGQDGGGGFAAISAAGGPGGAGGAGSGGGGGAGGDSIGIGWLGSTGPSINGVVISADQASPYMGITAGAKGAAGPGGAGGGGSTTVLAGSPGAVGVANAIQQFH